MDHLRVWHEFQCCREPQEKKIVILYVTVSTCVCVPCNIIDSYPDIHDSFDHTHEQLNI